MAIVISSGTVSTAGQDTGTALVITQGATAHPVGAVAFAIISSDNINTTEADHSEVVSVVDSKGNSWQKVLELTNGNGSAKAGVTHAVWKSTLDAAIASADTVTITFSADPGVSTAVLVSFTVAEGNTLVNGATPAVATVDLANGVSRSVAGLSSKERLYLFTAGAENAAGVHFVSSNFTLLTAATQGTGTTGIKTTSEYRVNTSTGETAGTTMGTADWVEFFFALEEAPDLISATPVLVADDKAYDGTVTATGTLDSPDFDPGHDVSIVASSIEFEDADVGVDKTVTASGLTLEGDDAGLYALTSSTAVDTADITEEEDPLPEGVIDVRLGVLRYKIKLGPPASGVRWSRWKRKGRTTFGL
jgi:hypothetical protein